MSTNKYILNDTRLHNNMLLQGVLWKLASCLCFSGVNICVRYLSTGMLGKFTPLPVQVVYFFQYFLASLIILPFLGGSVFVVKSKEIFKLHAARIIFAVIGTLCLYVSFKNMPIAQALSLTFIGPVFTVIGSRIFLGERLNTAKIGAILASIFGSILILLPKEEYAAESPQLIIMLLPIVSTLSLVMAKILTRQLSKKGESTENLTAYLLLFTVPITLIFALFNWQMPELEHCMGLIYLGIATALGFFAFNQAYKFAEVTFLMPFSAMKFFTSILLSFLLFNEYPHTVTTWLGMIVIVLGVTFLSYKKA